MDSFTFTCDSPDFSIGLLPDGATIQVSKSKLAENSGTFRDMFGLLDDEPPSPSTSCGAGSHSILEVVKDPKAFEVFLAVLHGWSAFTAPNEPRPWACDGDDIRLMFDEDALDQDKAFSIINSLELPTVELPPPTASGTPRLPNDIPVTMLGSLLHLFDKYDASQSCYYIAGKHLLLHVKTDPLQVYTLAHEFNMLPFAAVASRYLLSPDIETLTPQQVQKRFPSALSYHRLAELQSRRRDALRGMLLDTAKWIIENYAPADSFCDHSGVSSTMNVVSQVLLARAARRVKSDDDIISQTKEIIASIPLCGPCELRCEAAIVRMKEIKQKMDKTPWSLFRMR